MRIRAVLDDLARDNKNGRIWCASLVDDKDLVLEVLGEIVRKDPVQLRHAWRAGKRITGLRQDDRFKALLTEIGVIPLYRSEGWPDLCQPVGNDGFNCE